MRVEHAHILRSMLVLAALLAWADIAHAQQSGQVSLERARLASDRHGVLDVEWGAPLARGQWDVALWGFTAEAPLVRDNGTPLIERRIAGHLIASLGIFDWLQLGLEVPIIAAQSQDLASLAGASSEPQSGFGVGDVRIVPKFGLLRAAQHGVDLALLPAFTLATGTFDNVFIGESDATFAPELALSRAFGGVRVAVNAGMRRRTQGRIGSLVFNDELFARAGVGVRLDELGGPALELDATVSLATQLDEPFGNQVTDHTEALGAVAYQVSPAWRVFAGGGGGFARSVGTPELRLFLGVRLLIDDTDERKRDISAAAEASVASSEAMVDVDGDLVADADDACPDEAEDPDGFEDEDGCPDRDNDGDGTPDDTDACPTQQGPLKRDGCPVPDGDGDGIDDERDACPAIAGVESGAGCPDGDGDSVRDRLDNCPNEAGERDYYGCQTAQRVALSEDSVLLAAPVPFRGGALRERSLPVLDELAAVLTAHPELRVRIEVHVAERRDAAANQRLSEQRAAAVRAYLLRRGLDEERVEGAGMGESALRGDTEAAARGDKARVDVRIISNLDSPTDP
ncbi:OmpA family protein [Haliangium ochraceum]|uniref:OmpA/MotB domain protein n=1 Tax=Haliangium ochraceum (strain DSM 14365 / JCM 11303 / SMP-2) TaxID=502025 RepID=D0LHB1_HALO1|nr:OmpA family protein [Haliangium ochraceum]ACY18256.1 OmpA/MotB domain protein [Haliangium ochraceum DSM 14365]